MKASCRGRAPRDSFLYDWEKRFREGEGTKFVDVKVNYSGEHRILASEPHRVLTARSPRQAALVFCVVVRFKYIDILL